jgi:dihydroorotate dehydrogenase
MKKVVISAPWGIWLNIPGVERTKGTYTLRERKGRIWGALTRIWFTKDGIYNKMGMRNPGIKRVNVGVEGDIIYSVYGFTLDEFLALLDYIPADNKVELNFSCPNIVDKLTRYDIKLICQYAISKFDRVIVKLPANVYKGVGLSELVYLAGVRTFHACNTISTPEGGLSGRYIQAYSFLLIKLIKENHKDVTIIGGGGIYSADDVRKYVEAGADYIALGSVFFMPWRLPSVLYGIWKYLLRG